ncbi:phenol 2-monooxygenase [Glutamicibacter halophytocola]|uniref:FAD-dependent monooxygenase n=1 Tax=Glutamicibacter halophytocola TaxID=1933880 RepID=UPI0006D4AACD|nr:FAD-dependent monooxygenase [Glutamicibacter halophytocola]ALG28633.1 phenol 2-monooxygenase [Glutamicibacter halophytocola]NQD42008.1 3-hydroxybenzoate 4-monooxygenase [Glutamicibacter halophytocola]
MQFHHNGYVSADPRKQPAAGTGIDRPKQLPDQMDVLVVGTGPAGIIAAAQLSQFPQVHTRIIDRRPSRLEIGQADGIQSRTVETFQAFGFAERITSEAYIIKETTFWNPDPENPECIMRTDRTPDDPTGVSEFPHLVVNQARVIDYFAEYAYNSPARITPDFGWEFKELVVEDGHEYPVKVTLLACGGEAAGLERVVRAKYVVGADGARSNVRRSIGAKLSGDKANHAWGVMDTLALTDFPDVRTKCAIHSGAGSILLIPREGGQLFRLYVDLGEVPEGDNGKVRETPLEEIIQRAKAILNPYTLDVKDIAWHSVYEVGHRLADRFDDVAPDETCIREPRVFITGDACHTHSAKAGQGMNVSMQDGFNLAWKLGYVLTGRSPQSLLRTYSTERKMIARDLIDFDKQWSSIMAATPEALQGQEGAAEFYVRTAEFPAGFMTEYAPSVLTAVHEHQDLAAGFPIGKRFRSSEVMRVADASPRHLGHHHRADGRYRIYVFADRARIGEPGKVATLANWLLESNESPVRRFTPQDADLDSLFDVKVIYQQDYASMNINDAPKIFRPNVGELGLMDYEKVYAAWESSDIFEERQISREGAIIIVRPDMYVSHVLPLDSIQDLAGFFDDVLVPRI